MKLHRCFVVQLDTQCMKAKAGIDPTKMNFGNSPELNVAFGNAMKVDL